MATVVERKTATAEPGTWIVIPNVDWDTYEAMLALWGDRPSLRFTYDGENLEIMSPSPEHDEWAEAVTFIVVHAAKGLHVPCRSLRTSTWRKQAAERGLEADACFYLASCPRVRGKRRFDLNVDPPPDLAIEIEVSRGASDRMEIYARLGVPEVWRFDGEHLTAWQLQPDGSYVRTATSLNLPQLGLDEVVHWMNHAVATEDLTVWLEAYETWVRDELAPRVQAQ